MILLLDLNKITEEKFRIGAFHNQPNLLELDENELEQMGILVEAVPEPEVREKHNPVFYVNPFTKEVWVEYEERLLTSEEKIQQLENELTISREDNISNMLAITELYEMILGGTV